MNAGGEGTPQSPENQTPQSPEPIQSSRSEVDSEPVAPKSGVSRMEADSASADYGATGSASGATEGLPPDQPLPPGAEMLRRASGSSIDSFSGEGGDLNLLVAEQFQRRYAHFEVEMGPDGKPTLGKDRQPKRVSTKRTTTKAVKHDTEERAPIEEAK